VSEDRMDRRRSREKGQETAKEGDYEKGGRKKKLRKPDDFDLHI